MEEFPEEGPREPRRLEPTPETIDEWGGTPEPDFGKYGKLISEDLEKKQSINSSKKIRNYLGTS